MSNLIWNNEGWKTEWLTTIKYKNGKIVELPMQYNMTNVRLGNVLMGHLKNESGFVTNIVYAVGEGASGWDILADRGKSLESETLTALVAEVYRKAIVVGTDLSYLKEDNTTTADPLLATRIEINATLLDSEAPAPGSAYELREFALFGGTANATTGIAPPDTVGYMMNYFIQARTDWDSDIEFLTKRIRIRFRNA